MFVYAEPCRHCKRRKGSRRRGLCHKCYRDPEVRQHYDRLGAPPAVEEEDDDDDSGTGPARPCAGTTAAPRSRAKLDEMARRAQLREQIFGDGDGRIEACFGRETISQNLKIRRLRLARKWSMRELADRAGIRRWTVWKLERAWHTPTQGTLLKLARALGVPAAELLGN